MCLYPTLIRNKKYVPNGKNGGKVPPVHDTRTLVVPVGCGNCMECRKQYANGWRLRLLEDIKDNPNGKFITLTFNTKWLQLLNAIVPNEIVKKKRFGGTEIKEIKGYDRDNHIAKLAVRYFLERWRKKHGKSLRHWLVCELGHKGTEHLHLHGIVWTDDLDELERTWMYGFVWKGKPIMNRGKVIKYENYVNERTVNYIVKYITKRDEKHKYYKTKVLTSAGIGKNYINSPQSKTHKYNGTATNELYRTHTGHKISMPIYWRNNIYSEKEREELWIQKLNKETRYVGGEKIDISNSDKEYYGALEFYRKRNIQLGYGTHKTDWKRKNYEHQRRMLIHEKRMTM